MTKHSEASLLELLRKRYNKSSGNGDAHVFMPKVRNAAGFDAKRTADAVVMGLWPSRGLLLEGFEIKTSRSDWLRELKDPSKSEEFIRYMDRWWLIVSDNDVVRPGELPETWGLLVAHGNRHLVVKQEAAPLERQDVPATFLACLLRSAYAHGLSTGVGRASELVENGREADRERIQRQSEELMDLRAQRDSFSAAAGCWFRDSAEARKIGEQVRAALSGDRDLSRLEERIGGLRRQAAAILEATDELAASWEGAGV